MLRWRYVPCSILLSGQKKNSIGARNSVWQSAFLSQILYFLPDLVRLLETCSISEVLDNLSVILQKLSSRPESRPRLVAEPRLLDRLEALSKAVPHFYGGGGDVTVDAGDVTQNSIAGDGPSVSEFLWLNVQSVLGHLK